MPGRRFRTAGCSGMRRDVAHEIGAKRRQRGDHLRENLGGRGDDLAAVQKIAFAGQIADQAAGFLDQKAARGDVPGIQADFPESVVETRRRRRRGRARPRRGGAGPRCCSIIAFIISR